jgi:SpoVK/Ycf46/Vps4 family AAA+-type ATPase
MEPLQHQVAALDEIVARARAFYDGRGRGLSIIPRFFSLLAAPTGTGKTAVATISAEAIGATLLRISAPAWMPSGATKSSVKETIFTIAEAVAANSRTLLVIDEIDKIVDRNGDNSWKSYVRGEIFDLLDGRWPVGLTAPDDENENEIPREALTTKLQETVFILGIGTFQDWFDSAGSRRNIGFGAEIDPGNDELTSDIVADLLPRELAGRFNGSLIRLPELQPEHYHRIAKQAEDTLPERMRDAFRQEVDRRIGAAIEAKKGVRFLEESVMEVLKNLPPEPMPKFILPAKSEPVTPDPLDSCTL